MCTPTGFKENLLPVYIPREQNVIQKIIKDHFSDFEKRYDDHYADKYGKYRIIRIKEAVEKFLECGDYKKGIARIKCTNPDCDHEYFRPFSCKGWYLCPAAIKRGCYYSQNTYQKMCYFGFLTGSLYPRYPKFCVFISNMTENLGCLLRRHLEDVSRIVFSIIQDFYNEAAPIAVKTAAVVSYQSFGDLMRWNPHYHCDRQDVGNVDGAMEGGRRRSFWKAVSMRRALFTISL